MLRQFLAVIAGIIVGSLGIWLVERIGHSLYPFPADLKPDDIEGFKAYVENLPFMGKFIVILEYALGALVSGFVATKVANNNKPAAAIVCGGIFLFYHLQYVGFTNSGLVLGTGNRSLEPCSCRVSISFK